MTDVDVCIIGGGIQGCGVAQAVAAAGYKTLLIEQTGIAAATSCRSSKLIHGGLRYLESGQFGLVAKSLAERERLIRNAPELVRRVPFYIPIYKDTRRRPWQIVLGLSLYALLGRLQASACYRSVAQREWPQLDGLRQDGLQAVYQYWDAQTDDAELTRAVMYSAMQLGAELRCPARFISARYHNGHYQIGYEQGQMEYGLSSKVLVNAAGPWVKTVHDGLQTRALMPDIDLVQGTHLILKQSAPSGVYYVESPSDRRAVFVMPWYGHTMIGTTETLVQTDPASIIPTEHEIDYLRNIAHYYFPHNDDSVIDRFAGVRVLPKGAKGVFDRPRDTLLFTHSDLPGYLALIGGKLTAYRVTAETVLHLTQKFLMPRKPINNTRVLALGKAPEGLW
ncbi:MAG: FAD-dependent oxidoreductase [Gammaproteobacteria bacterium]|nr:FAD-dependent oxidoreductase [Gammaproteobacteria bacterium]